jgi:ABC-type multidrug transport system ATPase subunit
LGKKYNRRWVLRDVSFKVLRGKVTLISGQSGAGKSTLLNLLSGVVSPSEGNIFLFGENIKGNLEKLNPSISCAWSEISLFLYMSIMDNLRFFSYLNGIDRKTSDGSISELLNSFEIMGEKDKFVVNLSAGIQRKVDLCRAFINDSKILLLDEPSSFLDNKSKKKLVGILSAFKDAGKSIIIVSHHASLFSDLIDDVIILKKGRLIYYESVKRLLGNSKEFKSAYILKTSDRLAANELLRSMDKVRDTYVSQKALHIYLKEDTDLYFILSSLENEGIKIKKIINKEPNLDKLIGEIINAH